MSDLAWQAVGLGGLFFAILAFVAEKHAAGVLLTLGALVWIRVWQ